MIELSGFAPAGVRDSFLDIRREYAEEVVKRIAAQCAFVDERGGVGIRLQPAAVIEKTNRAALTSQRAKDFENLAKSLVAFVALASIQLALRRPARA